MSINRIVLILFFIAASGCRTQQGSVSQTKSIFQPPQRLEVTENQFSFVMATETFCTAFVFDRNKKIAITALHCGVEKGQKICLNAQNSSSASNSANNPCKYPGFVSEIREKAKNINLDYVIFEFKAEEVPINLQEVKLAGINFLPSMLKSSSSVLHMVGYPGDKYQNGNKTLSYCRVREDLHVVNFDQVNKDVELLLSTWKKEKDFYEEEDFNEMKAECEWALEGYEGEFNAFSHDCSTYGGNSGGPMFEVLGGVPIVVGLPYSYMPSPELFEPCMKYWDKYFRPVLKTDPYDFSGWDKFDRKTIRKDEMPFAIPMHLIVEDSVFLHANPQYTMNDPRVGVLIEMRSEIINIVKQPALLTTWKSIYPYVNRLLELSESDFEKNAIQRFVVSLEAKWDPEDVVVKGELIKLYDDLFEVIFPREN